MYILQVPDWPLQGHQYKRHFSRERNVLGGRSEVRIVRTRAILHTDRNPVVTGSTLSEVIILEVERGLSEAVAVGEVMDTVDDVERISASGIDVAGGWESRVVGVVEDLASGGLCGEVRGGSLEREDVVAAAEVTIYNSQQSYEAKAARRRRTQCWWLCQ